VDVNSQPVNLTSTPTTLTVATTIPTGSIGLPVVQVRTTQTGPVQPVQPPCRVSSESAAAASLRRPSVPSVIRSTWFACFPFVQAATSAQTTLEPRSRVQPHCPEVGQTIGR
jgi:hypothetical protein